jgi:hypothetical protein
MKDFDSFILHVSIYEIWTKTAIKDLFKNIGSPVAECSAKVVSSVRQSGSAAHGRVFGKVVFKCSCAGSSASSELVRHTCKTLTQKQIE